MSRPVKRKESGSSRDELQGYSHLFDRPEGVSRALYKKRRRAQGGEVRGAVLGRLAWRVKRVGEEQQPADHAGVVSGEHGRLPATVGMATEKDPLGRILRLEPSKRIHRVAQPIAVLGGLSESRRAVRALLPVGEVAAKHRESGINERAGHCHKQRRVAI